MLDEQENQITDIAFDRRIGTSGAGGQLYERELLMLLLLQGITKKKENEFNRFYLATNVNELGEFDDIVIKYSYGNGTGPEKSRITFLQAKHKNDPQKEIVSLDKLLSVTDKKDPFPLRNYFSSFLEIKKRFNERSTEDLIFKNEFTDCDFVIYTNALLDQNVIENNNVIKKIDKDCGNFLRFHKECCYFQINFGTNDEFDQRIINSLEYASDCKKLVKVLVNSIFPDDKNKRAELTNQGMIRKYYAAIAEKVITKTKGGEGVINECFLDGGETMSKIEEKFKDVFFDELRKKKIFLDKPISYIKDIVKEKRIKLPKDFGEDNENYLQHALPHDLIRKDEIKEFLDKLKLFFGQPNYQNVTEIIKDKIQKHYTMMSKADVDTVYTKVNNRIERWWMNERNTFYLTEAHDYFCEAKRYVDNLKRPPAKNLPGGWQLPPRNDSFVGRKQVLQELSTLLNMDDPLTIVVLHGLGGVGKTQLALEFVWCNLENYKGIIWFNATDQNSLLNEYIKLGQELNLIRMDEIRSISDDAKRVKLWLEDPVHAGWLMLCDNAPNYKDIANFLPVRGGKVVLTSRYDFGWPQITIPINVFEMQESIMLIEKILKSKSSSPLHEKQLASTLGHLPLAIAQASFYIRKTGMRIGDYLNMYNTRKQVLLSSKVLLETFPSGSNSESGAVVYVTWDITMDEINKLSSLAANWLSVCAYFGNNNIPKTLVEEFSKRSENNPSLECFYEAVSVLKSYSMIDINEEDYSMSVHNLVQEVTLLKSKENKNNQIDLKKALDLIKHNILTNPKYVVDHALSVWNHTVVYDDLVKKFCDLPNSIIRILGGQVRYNEAYLYGNKSIQNLQETLGPYHASVINAMSSTAEVLSGLGQYEEALRMFREVSEKVNRIFGPNNNYTFTALNSIAEILVVQCKYDDALEIFNGILNKMKEVLNLDCSKTRATRYHIATALYQKGQLEEALGMYEKIYDEMKNNGESFGLDAGPVLNILNIRALIYGNQGQHNEAVKVYDEVLEILRKTQFIGPDHPSVLVAKQNIACELHKNCDYERALATIRDVIDVQSRPDVLGPEHPLTLNSMSLMAAIFKSQGKYDDSLRIYKEVLKKSSRVIGLHHPSTLSAMRNVASLLDKQGNCEKALKMFFETLKAMSKVFESDHPHVLNVKNSIAVILFKMNERDEAMQIYEEVYRIQKKSKALGPRHYHTLTTLFNIAFVNHEQGRTKDAVRIYQEVIENGDKSDLIDLDDPLLVIAKKKIAEIFKSCGNYHEALKIDNEISGKRTDIIGQDQLTGLITIPPPEGVVILCDRLTNTFFRSKEIVGSH